MQSRREFGRVLLAGIPAAAAIQSAEAAIDSKVGGVRIGVITYSFRGMPVRDMIPAMVKIGLGEVELMSADAEQLAGTPANGLKDWRARVRPAAFEAVRKQFTDSGIDLRILCYNMDPGISDAEIDYAFRMARSLGVRIISSSSTVTVARRVAPVAEKYKILWGAHGHENVRDPEQFATPEVFAKVLAMGSYMGVNLDIGHFTAAGFDAVPFIKANHARITNIHLKDCKRNPPGGQIPNNNFPWGEGDTPIREVLRLLKNERWDIPANIEYEYNRRAQSDAVTEVARCFNYAKICLA